MAEYVKIEDGKVIELISTNAEQSEEWKKVSPSFDGYVGMDADDINFRTGMMKKKKR